MNPGGRGPPIRGAHAIFIKMEDEMLVERLEGLEEADQLMRESLTDTGTDALIKELLALMAHAAKEPGRAAKLRATYIIERLMEIAQDIRDGGNLPFIRRYSDVMQWLDKAAIYAAKLANPDTAGRYVEVFDQTEVAIPIYNPKDPSQIKEREKAATIMQGRFNSFLADRSNKGSSEPRRASQGRASQAGRNIIVPGGV